MLERLSRNEPSHLDLSLFWWVAANMYPYFVVSPGDVFNLEGYKALERSWYSLFVAAYKGEI